MRKIKTTISDIASIAKISKSTVSRYLNGGYVSEETKLKIEKAIKETNFVPNAFAQSLKAKKNNLIGIVVPRLDSYANSRTLAGIDKRLKELKYQLIISSTGQKKENEIESIKNFINQRVAGIIIISQDITEEHKKILRSSKMSVMLLGQEDGEFHSIVHDDYDAGKQIAEHIIKTGHKDICFVGTSAEDVSSWNRREKSFFEFMEKNKINNIQKFKCLSTIDEAKKVAYKIIKEEKWPTVIACSTDSIAIGVMNVLLERKIKIPEKISLISIGDYDIASVVTPSLTSVHYPYKSCGYQLADNIVKLINNEKVEKKITIPVKLILRKSIDKK